MGFPKKTKLEFFNSLFEKNSIPDIYSGITYFDRFVTNTDPSKGANDTAQIYTIRLVPEYIKTQMTNGVNLNRTVVKHHNWGYSINLNSSSTIDEYLESQFKSKYRSIIRRYVKRLESCFKIRYALFYGKISKDNFELIMGSLQKMIDKRFDQRNETHKEWHRWDALVEETYSLILNKEASLFVIYDNDSPIQISLNYHFDKMLFSSISSYDVDYAKFGLGHVEIYKQLEWCLENDYCIYEMGVGGMDYKRRWSNNIYQYEHHIVYSKRPMSSFFGKLEVLRVQIKEYLKGKKVNEIPTKIKSLFSKNSNESISAIECNIEKLENISSLDGYIEINHQQGEFSFLRKYVYDFLYSNTENIESINVLQSTDKKNIFVFKGQNARQLLTFEK